MKVLGLMGATVGVWLAAACSSGDVLIGTETVRSAGVTVSNEDAVERITKERCNRELSCANIGPERYWHDMASCRRDVHRQSLDYLQAETCTGGVDAYGLGSCVSAIRNSHCMSEGVPRLSECRAANLCR